MVVDPLTQFISAVAASLSAVTLALLGVDYYSVLYGLVGALFALYEAERMTRGRAVFFVVLSTLGGAMLGNGLLAAVGASNKFVLLTGCIVCGFGALAILARLLNRGLKTIDGKPAASGDDGGTSQ